MIVPLYVKSRSYLVRRRAASFEGSGLDGVDGSFSDAADGVCGRGVPWDLGMVVVQAAQERGEAGYLTIDEQTSDASVEDYIATTEVEAWPAAGFDQVILLSGDGAMIAPDFNRMSPLLERSVRRSSTSEKDVNEHHRMPGRKSLQASLRR